jgi:glutathione S-transferase
VIVEYLDSASPVSRLIPSSGRDRAIVKRWEALSDGISDAAATVFLERKRPTLQQSPEWILRQQQKITRGLEAAAQELGTKKWCNGDSYTLADIALVCALGYLALRFPEVEWRTSLPNLADLSNTLEKRASFVATLPKG